MAMISTFVHLARSARKTIPDRIRYHKKHLGKLPPEYKILEKYHSISAKDLLKGRFLAAFFDLQTTVTLDICSKIDSEKFLQQPGINRRPGLVRTAEDAMCEISMQTVSVMWSRQGKECYRLGTEFGKELERTQLNIDGEYIKQIGEKCVFIETHRSYFDAEGCEYTGVFVHVSVKNESSEKSILLPPILRDEDEKDFWEQMKRIGMYSKRIGEECSSAFILRHEEEIKEALLNSNTDELSTVSVIAPFLENGKVGGIARKVFSLRSGIIEKAIKEEIGNKRVNDGLPTDLFAMAVKALVYIHSGDPDLRELRPEQMTRKEKHEFSKQYSYEPSVPIKLISWDWKKPECTRPEEVSVRGHFRWQPHGKQLSQLKLIWIKDHYRTIKKKIHSEV